MKIDLSMASRFEQLTLYLYSANGLAVTEISSGKMARAAGTVTGSLINFTI